MSKQTDKRGPDEQVRACLTAEVHFAEWNQTLQPGTEMTVRGDLLDDERLKGRYEEV